MSEVSDIPFGRVLDPMERISETLFGLFTALTFICSLGAETAGNIKIQTMLIGALGFNLAWGIVDSVSIYWLESTSGEARSWHCEQYGRRRILKRRNAPSPRRCRRKTNIFSNTGQERRSS